MELNFPEHWGDCFAVNCEKDTDEGNYIAVDLISGDFHIVDVVIDDANEDGPDRADGMNDVKRKIELGPCEDGCVERENQAPEE